jgi:predicted lipid-binding transport protein (Tim44 family)
MPGGAPFAPHIPIPGGAGGGDSVFGMYCFIVLAVAFLAISGWCLGLAVGRRLRGGPQQSPANGFAPSPVGTGNVPPMQDLILSPDEVVGKSLRTTRLMQYLARNDHPFNPARLRDWVQDLFCRVQKCWQERDPGPVKDHLTSQALARYEGLIKTMRGNHLINRVDDLQVRRLEFVHVARPEDVDRHEFTALITFEAKAYFVHERSGTPVQGTPKNSWFQEFWTFQRHGDAWQLHQVKESWETGPLQAPNRAAGFSDAELRNAERGVIVL